MKALLKSSLSSSRNRLVELMQRINFGRIENLVIRNGDPNFDDAPRVVVEVKFRGENGPRAEASSGDFALKQEVTELFTFFDRVRNARIEVLSVKHGVPFGMHVQAPL